jgi:hypothetical protein
VVLLAGGLILLVTRGGTSTNPEQLAVGNCFDIPEATDRIGNLKQLSCTGPHDGEVFHVFDSSGLGATGYPSDTDWEAIVYPICDPVFASYTGTQVAEITAIEYRYLVPTADRWKTGARQVTCYITSPDGAPLSRSFRKAP